jgi:hypothetical protein
MSNIALASSGIGSLNKRVKKWPYSSLGIQMNVICLVSERRKCSSFHYANIVLTAEACPPHASFYNSGAPKDAPPRESVEVRLMVFTKR